MLPDGSAESAPDPALTLEFLLCPEDLAALARLDSIVRAGPSRPASRLWHDDDAQSLAARSLILVRDGPTWQIERLRPDRQHDWPACMPAPILSAAKDLADLTPSIPFDVTPICAFDGRAHTFRAGDVAIAVLHGTMRGVADARPSCRLWLTGSAIALAALLPTLTLRLSVPRASMAAEAIAAARGTVPPARHLGAPSLDFEVSVTNGLTTILSHLLDALLYWADIFRRQRDPEAIHQARVTTRRLRSALSIYKPVAACPELDAAAAAVKHCAATLGSARDWDVFLANTGASLAEMSGGDPRVKLLLRAVSRRRDTAYRNLSDYLDGPQFRHLEVSVGTATVLRPWERSGTAVPDLALHDLTAPFATRVLARRLKRVRHRGRDIATLPVPELHELRKDCKRLRYAAEFFAPIFPAKRTKAFLRRLSVLQEELGALNDASAATLLIAQLGRAGRGYAGGMVDGMAANAVVRARIGIVKSWKRFKEADAFWK